MKTRQELIDRVDGIHMAARMLTEHYESAPKGFKVPSLYLWVFKYYEQLEDISATELIHAADLPESYKTEISKALLIAPHVTVNQREAA